MPNFWQRTISKITWSPHFMMKEFQNWHSHRYLVGTVIKPDGIR
jgi:hypothetical protein